MADNTILIEIEFNGQKGFAKLNTDALKGGQEAGKEAAKGIEKGLEVNIPKALSGLKEMITGFGVAGLTVGAFGLAAKKAFSEFKEVVNIATEVKKVNAQFDFLTEKAGSSGEFLREAFANANNGILETTTILKTANVALSNLKIPATDIARNFEAARKISVGLGVDALDAFDSINRAIGTGSTRVLRQIGLFVDADQAARDYAKSVGLSAKFLTDAQKEAAIFEEIQKKVSQNFSNINLKTETVAIAFKQFGTASSELGESISVALTKIFGPSVQQLLSLFTEKIAILAAELRLKYGSASEAASTAQELLNLRIKQSQREVDTLKEKYAALGEDTKAYGGVLKLQIQEQENNIKRFREQNQLLDENKRKLEASTSFQQRAAGITKQLTEEEIRKAKELSEARDKLYAQTSKSALENAKLVMASAQTTQAFEEAKVKALNALEYQGLIERRTIKEQFAQVSLANSQAEKDALKEQEIKHAAEMKAIVEQETASMIKLRGIVQSGIVSGLAGSFSQLGKALVTGSNAFEAFGKAVISSLGAIAIQIGTMLVSIGLGFQTLGPIMPIWGLSGAAAVAAGLGLIVLGGALQAMGSGGEGASAGAGGGGGGGFGSGGLSSAAMEQPDMEKAKAQTQVNVNVEGNILDRRESGLEIANIIQEFFDTQDGVVAKA